MMKRPINYPIFSIAFLLLICTRCSRTQESPDLFDEIEDLIEVSGRSVSGEQQESNHNYAAASNNGQVASTGDLKARKCSKRSMILARQALMHELELIDSYNAFWFNDLDKDELVEEQKHSLGNMIMSSAGQELLNDNGQPLFEIESSYFRPLGMNQLAAAVSNNPPSINNAQQQQSTTTSNQAISIKLMRRKDRCYLSGDKSHYIYNVCLSVGPIEHNLDVIYNLPKELRLSQPLDWRYAQIKLIIPRMNYEITLKQEANYKLINKVNDHGRACPQELLDVTYLNNGANDGAVAANNDTSTNTDSLLTNYKVAIIANGLAKTNQTLMHLERIFNDYTRPTISNRLRQVLRFYLNSKTFPLSTV